MVRLLLAKPDFLLQPLAEKHLMHLLVVRLRQHGGVAWHLKCMGGGLRRSRRARRLVHLGHHL
jgi:hypothetical protein